MQRSAVAIVNPRGPIIPGSILVVAPREIARDELRMARLDDYLRAEFPDLTFTVADRASGAPEAGFVGIVPAKDGRASLTEARTREVVGQVVEALMIFLDYGERRH